MKKLRVIRNSLGIIASVFLLIACQSTFGPNSLKSARPAYNEALVSSSTEQMLLNLVRLRYGDMTYWLEVGSITTSMSFSSSVGIGSEIRYNDAFSSFLTPNFGVGYSNTPTITYSPLTGENFYRKFNSPVPLKACLVLVNSGWSIERVFGVCVSRMNDLYNTPRSVVTSNLEAHRFEQFKETLQLLQEFQDNNLIQISTNMSTKKPFVWMGESDKYQQQLDRIDELLSLPDHSDVFHFTGDFLNKKDDEVAILTRSISAMLYYMAQNIDVPQADEDAGLVRVIIHTITGEKFKWDKTSSGSIFKVLNSSEKPDNAYISIQYRGSWFYIADNDASSKSTFILILTLFNLRAETVAGSGAVPTLTLPVGR